MLKPGLVKLLLALMVLISISIHRAAHILKMMPAQQLVLLGRLSKVHVFAVVVKHL